MDEMQLSTCLQKARFVIFGGLGFSGCNMEFNANNYIYRSTLDRTAEIEESAKFDALYNRILPVLEKKNTIIMTHTPMTDWSNQELHPEIVYLSGHTHRNYFHDDGALRIYADNQIGYRGITPHLKTLLLDTDYDVFEIYGDGIYTISNEQYNEFYRAKNLMMTCTRKFHILYMLKKAGFYCFIHEAKNGSMTILNGGALKKVERHDIQWYYDHMDGIISAIKAPLDKYTAYQRKIAGIVKQFGGSGYIHGCIIDINWSNHIYVNPFDSSLTGYWAFDMVWKQIYPSIPSLLEQNCPELYGNYMKLIEGQTTPPFALSTRPDAKPITYLETDIYKASRAIKKMQKLNSNILSFWSDWEESTKTELPITEEK